MRVLKWFAVAVVAVVLALVLGAVVPRPFLAGPAGGDPVRTILVVANPIHTDIVLPLDADLADRFVDLAGLGLPVGHPDARWLAFGWGSRAFYIETPTWSDLKPGPLFKALTVDASVMHVTVAGEVDRARPEVTEYRLDQRAFDSLVAFIEASFVTAEGGARVPVPGAAYGTSDAFFEARGTFNALAGCNTWTASALRAAGLQTGWWNPLPQSLAWSLALHN